VTEETEQDQWKNGWASLRHRDFRVLWAGTFVSNAGSWMQKIATAWLIYHLTGSQAWLGTDAFASGFTTVVLLPVGGVIADRLDRRWLLIWTNTACAALALVLALLSFAGVLHVWHIITVSALGGIVQAAMVPASTSLLPALVGESDVPNAIALNSLQFNLSRVAGPAIGGLTLVYLGAGWSFAINAASFLVLVAAFMLIRTVPAVPQGKLPLGRSLLDGLRFIRGRTDLIVMLALVAAIALLGAPVVSLLPALVKDVFGRQASSYSFLLTCFGAGAVVAAVASTLFGQRGSGLWAILLAFVIVGICQVAVLFSTWSLVIVLVFIGGFGFVGAMIRLGTEILQQTDDAFRGRVTSVQQICFRAGQPIGALLGGFIGQAWGVRVVFSVFGGVCVAVAVLTAAINATRR